MLKVGDRVIVNTGFKLKELEGHTGVIQRPISHHQYYVKMTSGYFTDRSYLFEPEWVRPVTISTKKDLEELLACEL